MRCNSDDRHFVTTPPKVHQWSRHSTEAVVGAVTGTLAAPTTALLGRFDSDGQLQYAGRTTMLNLSARQALARELQPGRPGHPWTGWAFSAGWGSREQLAVRLSSRSWSPRSRSTCPWMRPGAGATPCGWYASGAT